MARALIFALFSSSILACAGSDVGTSSDIDAADSAHGDTFDVGIDSARDDIADTTDTTDAVDTTDAIDTADTNITCGTKTCVSGQVCERVVHYLGDAGPDGGGYPPCGPGGTCGASQECIDARCHEVTYGCVTPPSSCPVVTCSGSCGPAICAPPYWCMSVDAGVVTCGYGS